MSTLAYLPSPSQSTWYLGPVPIRAYALCILAGVFLAVWLGGRRWRERGGVATQVGDVAIWAVPFGVVGGRLYHVLSSPDPYFGEGGDPMRAFAIWEGGLGIWGAIALGTVGAWIGCRRQGIALPAFADAVAPGVALAQAVGRFGNWFNQELYGRPTTLPWALEIDEGHRPPGGLDVATYHPTFLYEALWNVGVAGLVIWADRRFRLGHGRAFALYIAAYTAGRFWIEMLRIDPAEQVLGLRLNVWTSVLVFAGALTYFVLSSRRRPGREVLLDGVPADAPSGPNAETIGADAASASVSTPATSSVATADPPAPASDAPDAPPPEEQS